jgi:hypothetical protein
MANDQDIRERLVRVETQIQGIAAASTVLSAKAESEIAAVRNLLQQEVRGIRDDHSEQGERIAKLEAALARFEALENRLEKVREDVTGRHTIAIRSSTTAARTGSEPPPARRRSSSFRDQARFWGPIIMGLISLIGTLITYILHQH